MNSRYIRFVDTCYEELFTIPDGESITITFNDGHKENRTCRFYDIAHTEIGGKLFHIEEWAEIMERNGYTYAPTTDYERDKFFINDDSVTEVYYNPDAKKGGQLVYNEISFELIREAAKNTTSKTGFFDYIQSGCRQYLIDKGTAEYKGNLKSFFERKADFENSDGATMRKLKKLAGVEPTKSRKHENFER